MPQQGGPREGICLPPHATQMDVHKTLHLFHTTKKMPNVKATAAQLQCFPYKKILHLANVRFREHGYFRTG